MALPSMIQDTLTAAHRDVLSHCMRVRPVEAVGMVWDDSLVTELANTATKPRQHFFVDGDVIGEIVETRPDRHVTSIYHSHPSGQLLPSETDIDNMLVWDDLGIQMTWTVVALTKLRVVMSTWQILEGTLDLVHRLPCEYPLRHAY